MIIDDAYVHFYYAFRCYLWLLKKLYSKVQPIFQAAAKARKDSLASEASSSGDKKLQNQFSFVERATQTMNNAFKVSLNATLKIPSKFWEKCFLKIMSNIIHSGFYQSGMYPDFRKVNGVNIGK